MKGTGKTSWVWNEPFTSKYSEQTVLQLSALLLPHFVVLGGGVWIWFFGLFACFPYMADKSTIAAGLFSLFASHLLLAEVNTTATYVATTGFFFFLINYLNLAWFRVHGSPRGCTPPN